jgi:hypothetical protein
MAKRMLDCKTDQQSIKKGAKMLSKLKKSINASFWLMFSICFSHR